MRLLNLAAAAATVAAVGAAPSFVVQNNQFMLDGAPFTIKSGSFHYFRSHPDQWVDRLTRLKAMGLNTVQVREVRGLCSGPEVATFATVCSGPYSYPRLFERPRSHC